MSRVPIFAGLSADQQQKVAAYARHIELVPGERLYAAGDPVSQLFVVHRGRVRMVRLLAPGREQLIRMAGPADVVGEYPFLTGHPPVAWVFATEPTLLCVFDHAALEPLITAYPAIALRLLRSLAERLGDAERRFAELAAVDVPTRLADYLLALPARSGPGPLAVRLPMMKKDVASYLGTTPESLSRALHRLQEDGLVEVREHGRVDLLDRPGLEALVREGRRPTP